MPAHESHITCNQWQKCAILAQWPRCSRTCRKGGVAWRLTKSSDWVKDGEKWAKHQRQTAAEAEGVPADKVDLVDQASCQSPVNIGILGITSWYGVCVRWLGNRIALVNDVWRRYYVTQHIVVIESVSKQQCNGNSICVYSLPVMDQS